MVLTGLDATAALQMYSALGAANARFDARKVAAAAVTAVGRARVHGAVMLARRIRPARVFATPRRRRSVSRSAAPMGSRGSSPGRPGRRLYGAENAPGGF